MRSRIASSRFAAELRRAPTNDTCAPIDRPARLRRLRRRASPAGRRCRCRACAGSSAGKRRPRSPSPAADSTAVAAACRTTSPSEWPYRRGASSIDDAAQPQPISGPKPCVSWPRPMRVPRSATRRRRVPRRSRGRSRDPPGSVTLRFGRLAGDGRDGDAAALEQRGFVRVARGVRRREGVEQQLAARALRRLGTDQARRGRPMPRAAAAGALERVDDRHDRDGRAVLGGRRGDGVGERRRRERPRAHRGRARPRRRWRATPCEPNPSAARRRRRPCTPHRCQRAATELARGPLARRPR